MILLTQLFSPSTYGIAFVLIGVILRMLVRWRRFKRRVFYRTYRYRSYLLSEVVPLAEGLVSLTGLLLILLGLFIYLWA